MKVTFDDTWYNIEIDDEDFTMKSMYEFQEMRDILLTSHQMTQYIIEYTNRTFDVSIKRINAFKKHLISPKNIWRK